MTHKQKPTKKKNLEEILQEKTEAENRAGPHETLWELTKTTMKTIPQRCLPGLCDKDDNVAAATWSLCVFALCVCSVRRPPAQGKTDTDVSECGSLKSRDQQSYRQRISG